MPGGYRRYANSTFNDAGYYGTWWTATDYGDGVYAYYRIMYYNTDNVSEDNEPGIKNFGLSVRCVFD